MNRTRLGEEYYYYCSQDDVVSGKNVIRSKMILASRWIIEVQGLWSYRVSAAQVGFNHKIEYKE